MLIVDSMILLQNLAYVYQTVTDTIVLLPPSANVKFVAPFEEGFLSMETRDTVILSEEALEVERKLDSLKVLMEAQEFILKTLSNISEGYRNSPPKSIGTSLFEVQKKALLERRRYIQLADSLRNLLEKLGRKKYKLLRLKKPIKALIVYTIPVKLKTTYSLKLQSGADRFIMHIHYFAKLQDSVSMKTRKVSLASSEILLDEPSFGKWYIHAGMVRSLAMIKKDALEKKEYYERMDFSGEYVFRYDAFTNLGKDSIDGKFKLKIVAYPELGYEHALLYVEIFSERRYPNGELTVFLNSYPLYRKHVSITRGDNRIFAGSFHGVRVKREILEDKLKLEKEYNVRERRERFVLRNVSDEAWNVDILVRKPLSGENVEVLEAKLNVQAKDEGFYWKLERTLEPKRSFVLERYIRIRYPKGAKLYNW